MSKINKFIKSNINTIITIFILMQPILDLFVSLAINVFHISLNIGIILRMLFLVFMFYVALVIYHKKKILIYIFLCMIYGIIFLLVQDKSTILANLHGLMRVFYFPALLLILYSIRDNIKIYNKYLVYTLFIYIILIFVAVVTNTGFKSYDIAKKGSLGWFNSTNEISCIISILIPIMCALFKDKKNYIIKIIGCLIFLFIIGEIGTKTPVLALGITFVTTLVFLIVKSLRVKDYKLFTGLVTIIVIGVSSLILLLPKTNFYKNIEIHMKYLKIDSIEEIFGSDYVFDHFIFSQRITFLKNTDMRYSKASTLKKLFGIGYVNSKGKEYKAIEMDYYDVFYNHGVIGFVIYFGLYIYVLHQVFKNLPKKIGFSRLMEYLSLVLILILSLYSGHVITSPAVSIYVVIIIMGLLSNDKALEKVG